MKRGLMVWLPGALLIVVIPVTFAVTGQSLHPWRLTWLIPLGVVAFGGLVVLLSRLKP